MTQVCQQVATLATLLACPALAAGGPFFALSAERGGTSFQHVQALVEWRPDRGRFGGPALQLRLLGARPRHGFCYCNKPRSIVTPNRCRAEAWLLEGPGECQLHLVLYPARGTAAGRRYPLALHRPAAAPDGGARTKRWCYAAVDCALEADQGLVPFNVEVSITGGAVLLDGLAVVGADSLVRNGDFAELEYGPSAPGPTCGDGPALGIPRGWRRHYAVPRRGTGQAAAQYGVDTQSSSAGLTVRKEQGQFTLSAEPIAVPEAADLWVARAFAASAAGQLPTLALRQYGRQGLVQEARSDRVWQHEQLAIVSTGKLPRHPQTEKLLLLLDFPQAAGTYCVERVEVALLAAQSRSACLRRPSGLRLRCAAAPGRRVTMLSQSRGR